MDQDARADNTRGAPRPVHHASRRQQNGEGEPAKPNPLRYSGRPKEPQQRSPVHDTKATATPLHPAQREDSRGRDKRRSDRTAIPPPDNGNDTPERTEPTDETHRAETRKPPQTEHEATANGHRSDQTDDANARHKPTAKATASRANERRDTHQTAPRRTPGATEPKTETPDAQDTRPPKAQQAPETTQQGDNSPHHNATAQRAQQTAENRGARGQQTEATRTQTPPRHQKHQKHQHGEKPKNKSKKDGSWRQAVEREKVASSETTVRARSTRTTTEEAR